MIIFDLDGTLANCEHRRHFVDASKNPNYESLGIHPKRPYYHKEIRKRFEPDWKSFYEACDKDKPIEPVISIFTDLWEVSDKYDIEIWSGRCESVMEKTIIWLDRYLYPIKNDSYQLKMRPLGDNTPDDQLKEKWLNDWIAEGGEVECVFDDRPKVVRMWRRRGIFVFDVNQSGEEF